MVLGYVSLVFASVTAFFLGWLIMSFTSLIPWELGPSVFVSISLLWMVYLCVEYWISGADFLLRRKRLQVIRAQEREDAEQMGEEHGT